MSAAISGPSCCDGSAVPWDANALTLGVAVYCVAPNSELYWSEHILDLVNLG